MVKLPHLVDAREMTTRKFGNGRTRWIRLNHDRRAIAVWHEWVLAAPNEEEMLRRASAAFIAEEDISS
jgi:hypothetical protein